MTNAFKTRLLQHLATKRNSEKGFTLIELLVVIIIIGILSAVALPQFLNQTKKARAAEATSIVGSIIRAQQAYRLEKQAWAPACAKLNVDLPDPATSNFTYDCNVGSKAATDDIEVVATGKASGDYDGMVVTGKYNRVSGVITTEAKAGTQVL